MKITCWMFSKPRNAGCGEGLGPVEADDVDGDPLGTVTDCVPVHVAAINTAIASRPTLRDFMGARPYQTPTRGSAGFPAGPPVVR
jgi:hypothetical protein